jgi:hypothetical protein
MKLSDKIEKIKKTATSGPTTIAQQAKSQGEFHERMKEMGIAKKQEYCIPLSLRGGVLPTYLVQ